MPDVQRQFSRIWHEFLDAGTAMKDLALHNTLLDNSELLLAIKEAPVHSERKWCVLTPNL